MLRSPFVEVVMKKLSAAVALLVLSAGPAWAGVTPQPAPVPEPATLGLIAGGAVMLGLVAWRRNKK